MTQYAYIPQHILNLIVINEQVSIYSSSFITHLLRYIHYKQLTTELVNKILS